MVKVCSAPGSVFLRLALLLAACTSAPGYRGTGAVVSTNYGHLIKSQYYPLGTGQTDPRRQKYQNEEWEMCEETTIEETIRCFPTRNIMQHRFCYTRDVYHDMDNIDDMNGMNSVCMFITRNEEDIRIQQASMIFYPSTSGPDEFIKAVNNKCGIDYFVATLPTYSFQDKIRYNEILVIVHVVPGSKRVYHTAIFVKRSFTSNHDEVYKLIENLNELYFRKGNFPIAEPLQQCIDRRFPKVYARANITALNQSETSETSIDNDYDDETVSKSDNLKSTNTQPTIVASETMLALAQDLKSTTTRTFKDKLLWWYHGLKSRRP